MLLELLLALLMAHCLADFALQSPEMGKGKNRNRPIENVPPGQVVTAVWPYWLTAHAGVHGLFVYLVTGSILVGCLEWVAHWVIDFCKCENLLTVHQDQALHAACKVVWVLLIGLNFATPWVALQGAI